MSLLDEICRGIDEVRQQDRAALQAAIARTERHLDMLRKQLAAIPATAFSDAPEGRDSSGDDAEDPELWDGMS